jgi:hypothetical protein
MKCPNCKSVEIRKHGFYRGKQRYQCKSCNRQFVDNPSVYLAPEVSTGVEERIDRYIRSISTPSTDLLLNLQRATADYPLAKMQPTLAQVEFIALSIQSTGASRVLEAGIFSGYSTLAIALALPAHGRVISCGVAGTHLEIARTHWEWVRSDRSTISCRSYRTFRSDYDRRTQTSISSILPPRDRVIAA